MFKAVLKAPVMLVVALVAALGLAAAPALADPTFPDLAGRRVVDEAHVLSSATQEQLTAKLADLEARTHRQMIVATVPSLQGYEIEEYGYQLGRKWGIGRSAQNDGLLLLVAPTEKKVRVEVGYGLEPIVTDAFSGVIIRDKIVPRFKAGDIDGGVTAGADALIAQLSADAPQAQAAVQQASRSTRQAHRRSGGFIGIVPLIILFVIFSSIFRRRRHWGGGGWGGLWPLLLLSSATRRSNWGGGDWGGGGGGGWSSGGGGGGGFSGGGGSFGGGGASGSW
jgi:uncharacterized protein